MELPRAETLKKKYRATVQVGTLVYAEPPKNVFMAEAAELGLRTPERVRSVQIDMHPSDFELLSDFIEFAHQSENLKAHNTDNLSHFERFVKDVYHQWGYESKMRLRHPLLMDLYNQYQTTLHLLESK